MSWYDRKLIEETGLSGKDKSFLGLFHAQGINEWFLNVADLADPDTAIWTVTEDNDGTVRCIRTAAGGYIGSCHIVAGSGSTNDSVISSQELRCIDFQGGYSERYADGRTIVVGCRTKFSLEDLTGEAAIGMCGTAITADQCDSGTAAFAGIHCDNDVVRAITDNRTSIQATTLTTNFSNATSIHLMIKSIYHQGGVGTNRVEFYLNDVLKATHSTNINYSVPVGFVAAAKNTNSVATDLRVNFVQLWSELG